MHWLRPLCCLLLFGVVACKDKSAIDKKLESNTIERETQKAKARDKQGAAPAKLKAMNWRTVAVASSFASIGRKRIDALGEMFPWQVDVFEETGDHDYDRVDIDKDRDGEVDESWTFRDGHWEKFGGRLFWSGTAWTAAGAGDVALPQVSTRTAGGEPLHEIAIEMLHHKAADYEVADFFADHGPKVALHDDDWDARWDRAEIDRDRDGKIDERWLRKGTVLIRRVLADKRTFLFRKGAWQQDRNAKWPTEEKNNKTKKTKNKTAGSKRAP